MWRAALRAADAARGDTLVVDLAGAQELQTAGAALVAAVLRRHGNATLRGASPAAAALVAQCQLPPPSPSPSPRTATWTVSDTAASLVAWAADATAFVGESVVAALHLPARRRQFRWADMLRLTDQAGFQAIPLVLLMGYLMGLILAFQSSIPLRRFGADLFVVNLVAISLMRELGPLLAAVILAGRTASAFAAELGTMVVNEEVAALQTMGISPMTMLVLPRLAAAVVVMPILTLVLDLAGLLGMVTVMLAFGFSPASIGAQLVRAAHARDLWGGLFKALCFGAAVAGIGCRAGLAAGLGPRAVGQAATAAVVGGIVATVMLDGVFAVLFYRLGL